MMPMHHLHRMPTQCTRIRPLQCAPCPTHIAKSWLCCGTHRTGAAALRPPPSMRPRTACMHNHRLGMHTPAILVVLRTPMCPHNHTTLLMQSMGSPPKCV